MSLIKRNLAANFGGRIIGTVVSLAFVPVYIKVMGVEAYGLVGVFISLQAIFGLLDLGLSTTVNREMARMSGGTGEGQNMRNMVRSLEFAYWAVAVLITGVVVMLSGPIASNWVNAENLSEETVNHAIMIMGGIFAFQWPLKLYQGGLMGLQRQVLMATIDTSSIVLRAGGAVLVLWFVSPTIEAFFIWQMATAAITVVVTAVTLWRVLPKTGKRSHFDLELLKGVWKFAAGMTGISLVVFFLMNLDKILLSKLLSLEAFGYYVLATSAAGVMSRFVGPVFSAVFPRLSQLVSLGDEEQVATLYHKSCQLMSLLILPLAAVAVLFNEELLFIWTGDVELVRNTALPFALLIAGNTMNGLMNVPYALQLAHGWTQLAFYMNVIAVTVFVPLLFVLVHYYGVVGGALSWMLLNLGYVSLSIRVMHRRLLKGEMWGWYLLDVGRPLVVALGVAVPLALLMPLGLPRFWTAGYIAVCGGLIFAATAIATPMAIPYIQGIGRYVRVRLTSR